MIRCSATSQRRRPPPRCLRRHRPAARVLREVVEVMRELNVDLSGRTPKRLTIELARWADLS